MNEIQILDILKLFHFISSTVIIFLYFFIKKAKILLNMIKKTNYVHNELDVHVSETNMIRHGNNFIIVL